MTDENESIEISRELSTPDELVEKVETTPIQKKKKPLSMAKKKALLKANEARKRNALARKKAKKMKLAQEYLDELIPDELDTIPEESEEEEEIVNKKKQKSKPKPKKKKKKTKVVYYSSSESEMDSETEEEEYIEKRRPKIKTQTSVPYSGITFL